MIRAIVFVVFPASLFAAIEGTVINGTTGKPEGQILDEFVAENGAGVLAVSPGPWGNATPYIALALGLGVVFLAIRYYRHVRPAPAVPAGDDAALSRYHDQIEKDLSKLE